MLVKVVRLSDEHHDELHELLIAENWTQLAKELREDGLRVFTQYVALVDGHVVGWLEGILRYKMEPDIPQFPKPWAQINYVLVHPALRRRGVAGSLIRHFARDEGAVGRAFVVLWTDWSNAAHLSFVETFGFASLPGTDLLGASLERVLASLDLS
ncbi:GNAT family N-acetyltransferase [Streptomyces wuyuanensis]|uniref:GNAT family N-acetyltransferase n=1 Tax=Streptomyces wuyuanensis TaxID=1196353 RepID=UPI0037967A6E